MLSALAGHLAATYSTVVVYYYYLVFFSLIAPSILNVVVLFVVFEDYLGGWISKDSVPVTS